MNLIFYSNICAAFRGRFSKKVAFIFFFFYGIEYFCVVYGVVFRPRSVSSFYPIDEFEGEDDVASLPSLTSPYVFLCGMVAWKEY